MYSQDKVTPEYRVLEAYIEDFTKNELYVKKSLIEYTNSILENQLLSRSKATSLRIIEKLKNINLIIKKNDLGYKNNILLRDSFLKMNQKTIECLNDGTLIMNDYVDQSNKNIFEINKDLKAREIALASYFEELKNYDKTKIEFGETFNLNVNTFSGQNILEYNAFQNLLYYKINILDEKLNAIIMNLSKDEYLETIKSIDLAHQDIIEKTDKYKNIFKDNSLNNENILFTNYILSQKKKIIPLYNDFITEYNILQNLKKLNSNTLEFIEKYNQTVKSYNIKKNILFDELELAQKNKKIMADKWFAVNRAFLKNNIKMDSLYESYSFSK